MRKLSFCLCSLVLIGASLQACGSGDGADSQGGAGEGGALAGSGGQPGSGGDADSGGTAGERTGGGPNGSGGTLGGAAGAGGGSTGDEVLDSLLALGVDVKDGPRLGDDSEPLPEDYAPFGSAQSFDTIDELLLLGASFAGQTSRLTLFELQSQNDRPLYEKENFFVPPVGDTPWAASVGTSPEILRATHAADLDGDGLDEVAVLFQLGPDGPVELLTYQESVAGGVIDFQVDHELVVSETPALGLSLGAGDFDGDGSAELVLGLARDSRAELLFSNEVDGELLIEATEKELPQISPGSRLDLTLETGNLDYDRNSELVVVVNEINQTVDGDQGTSRYYIIDDSKTEYADLESGLIRASIDTINRTAVVADVSIGDIDKDQVDEIVFGGLQGFDPAGTCSYRYLLIALDDIKRDTAVLSASELEPNLFGGCSMVAPGELRYVHVNLLDLDGDGFLEVQANEVVFDDFMSGAPWSPYQWGTDEDDNPLYATIDHASLFATDGGFTEHFGKEDSTMTVGDVTADGRQNIVFYSQATNALETWGLSNPDDGSAPLDAPIFSGDWRKMNALEVQDPGLEPVRPALLSSNVNHDSTAIKFSEGSYRLIYTEPLVIAALAAAPCGDDFGQNDDGCRTSYGTGTSDSQTEETVHSVRAGVVVGFESEFSVLGVKVTGFELTNTIQGEASWISSSAYTVEKTISYTTGPIEDTVIFNTIPLDQYTYEVTSHPDPELIGSKVVISLPREPIDLQVERQRYNQNVVAGGPVIGEQVFSHQLGKPQTYPSASEKSSLLRDFEGLETGPVAVGNSGGGTELTIDVADETTSGTTYGINYDLEVRGTVGSVVLGFSLGYSYENSLQVTHGTSSSYSGSVSDMDVSTEEFGMDRYSWGMFTYVFDDPESEQQYEVINYWVQ